LDILVNNAGSTRRGDVFALSEDDWRDGFALKFFGYVRLTRAAPLLKPPRGAIVNIVGIGGRTPGAEFAIGGSVNAALLAFTKTMAEIGIKDGTRVSAINPGAIETDRLLARIRRYAAAHALALDEARRRLLQRDGCRPLRQRRRDRRRRRLSREPACGRCARRLGRHRRRRDAEAVIADATLCFYSPACMPARDADAAAARAANTRERINPLV
jgi:hypothetical protein